MGKHQKSNGRRSPVRQVASSYQLVEGGNEALSLGPDQRSWLGISHPGSGVREWHGSQSGWDQAVVLGINPGNVQYLTTWADNARKRARKSLVGFPLKYNGRTNGLFADSSNTPLWGIRY